jgi:hypothetical protein
MNSFLTAGIVLLLLAAILFGIEPKLGRMGFGQLAAVFRFTILLFGIAMVVYGALTKTKEAEQGGPGQPAIRSESR